MKYGKLFSIIPRLPAGMATIGLAIVLVGALFVAPQAEAAVPADFGLNEGDLISASGDPDIYIVNEHGYKRLFLNPEIFNFYGHLGGFGNVRGILGSTRDAFGSVSYVRNCETDDPKVYAVEVTGEDTATLHWFNMSGEAAAGEDPDFFKKIFCINNREFNWYSLGAEYLSTSDVEDYSRDFVGDITWQRIGGEWQASATPPACSDPLVLATPVDLNLATSVLYPGQYRGGNYKAHGGFRFDSSSYDEISVYMPMDAKITRVARYLGGGEAQYLFDMVNDCGIMFRFDHLRLLSDKFLQVAETVPLGGEDDTRTTNLQEPVSVTEGELIATGVGVGSSQTPNVFVDWGVYDLRQKNSASADEDWLALHDNEQGAYGVCWFSWLSSEDEATVRSLPASGGDYQSDYCN